MNKLSPERKNQVLKVLFQGNSISHTARITDTAINTVVNLIKDVGSACLDYQDSVMRNLPCRKLQCDAIWSFAYPKAKAQPTSGESGSGDIWTFTALDLDTKLVPCWKVGVKNAESAYEFTADLKDRLAHSVRLTTDGHRTYLEATEPARGSEVDYAVLVKLYETEAEKPRKQVKPNVSLTPPLPLERQNLTMRMSMRRFAQLTSTKKLENHMYALALYFMHYNFARSHKSLTNPFLTTPAMEAGVTDHFWSIDEIVTLA